jgi:hypothetical protein
MSYPAIHSMTDRNLVGLCHIDWVDVDQIAAWPDEVNGNLIGDIELIEGATWNRVTLEDDTGALFAERWRLEAGVQHSDASITGDVAKDRLSLMPKLWTLKGRRCVARIQTRNGDILVMGTKEEPATAVVTERTAGQDVDSDRNQYSVVISVSRRLPVPWYQGVVDPPPPAPMDCLPVVLTANGGLFAVYPSGSEENISIRLNGVEAGSGGAGVWNIVAPTELCDVIEAALVANPTVGFRLTRGSTTGVIPETGITNGRSSGSQTNWAGTGFTASYQWNGTAWLVSDGVTLYSSTEDVPSPADVTSWTGGPPSITLAHSGPMLLTSCLTPTQLGQLLQSLVQQQSWAALEAILTPPQLAAAIESLGGGGGGEPLTLCEAVDLYLNNTDTAGILLTIDGDEAFVPQNAIANGRPRYLLPVWPGTGFTLDAYWDGSQWVINDSVNEWTSSEDVPMIHLVTTWDGPGDVSIALQGPLYPTVLLDCLTAPQKAAIGGTVQLLDENDDPIGSPIAVPAGGAITAPAPIPPLGDPIIYEFGRSLWSGQTSSYVAGDEGALHLSGWFDTLQTIGRNSVRQYLVDHETLGELNHFGNTQRWTALDGSAYATSGDRMVIDHFLKLQLFIPSNPLQTGVSWTAWMADVATQSHDGHTDWVVPPLKIWFAMARYQGSNVLLHGPFQMSAYTQWSSTTASNATGSVLSLINTGGTVVAVAKTSTTNRYGIVVRKWAP